MRDYWTSPWLWAVAGIELAIWIFSIRALARVGGRQGAASVRTATPGAMRALRLAYLAATGAVGFDGWYAARYEIPAYLHFTAGGALPPVTFAIHGMLGLAFVTLIWRPYAWGKLVAGFAGLVWTISGLATALLSSWPLIPPSFVCGLVFLGAAAVHQVVDPRFGGAYLRVTQPD
jgi:hypothetical protein